MLSLNTQPHENERMDDWRDEMKRKKKGKMGRMGWRKEIERNEVDLSPNHGWLVGLVWKEKRKEKKKKKPKGTQISPKG